MSGQTRDMALRRAGTVSAVVLACGIVAVASPGVGILVGPAADGTEWLGLARTGGIAALLIGVALLLPAPQSGGRSFATRPDPRTTALSAAITTMVLVTLLALFAPPILVDEQPGVGVPDPSGSGPVSEDAVGPPPPSVPPGGESPTSGFQMEDVLPPPPPERAETPPPAEPNPVRTPVDWGLLRTLANAALLVVILGLALVGWRAWKGRLGPQPLTDETADDEARVAVGLGLQKSLAEMDQHPDSPREQIKAAYRTLLSALAEAGVPRLPQEAPHEHLSRTLGALGVPPTAMYALTRAYVSAQFGDTTVTEGDKQRAQDALRDSLRLLQTRRDLATPFTPAPGVP